MFRLVSQPVGLPG